MVTAWGPGYGSQGGCPSSAGASCGAGAWPMAGVKTTKGLPLTIEKVPSGTVWAFSASSALMPSGVSSGPSCSLAQFFHTVKRQPERHWLQ